MNRLAGLGTLLGSLRGGSISAAEKYRAWRERRPSLVSAALGILLLACILGLAAPSSHSYEGPMTDSLFTLMGLYSDLVVQGRILSAQITKVDAGPYLHPVDSHGQVGVIEVLLKVTRVLAGEYSDSTIAAIVRQGKIGDVMTTGRDLGFEKLHAGDEVIIGLNYAHTSRDLYMLDSPQFFLKIVDSHVALYSDKYLLQSSDPIAVIEAAARKRDIAYVYRGAEIVCLATLVENDEHSMSLTLTVDRVIKGSVPSRSITLDYNHDFAMWHMVGPKMLLFSQKSRRRLQALRGDEQRVHGTGGQAPPAPNAPPHHPAEGGEDLHES